jgi:L-seryl-tRNA(Ser) seleniumtransferase
MPVKSNQKLRKIPSVSAVLESPETRALIDEWSFVYVSFVAKREVAKARLSVQKGGQAADLAGIIANLKRAFNHRKAVLIKPIVNATGVVLHTNLGRSPLGELVLKATNDSCAGYCNLEYDIETGKRSKRGELAGELAAALAGAEAGLVVNNCAAAVLLAVSCLAPGKEILVSRGELVQIGGGFRIPEIITASGAKLKEVGTTNRTVLNDYAKGITKNTGLILKVHRSNFQMRGFTEETNLAELASLARKKHLPILYDLGSGMADDFGIPEFANEPNIASATRAKADLVCFSGDKLLGGPQAGIIAGRQKYISVLGKHPLYRPLRPDKLCLCALEQTLLFHLTNPQKLKLKEMFGQGINLLQQRAEMICAEIGKQLVSHTAMKSVAGGGSTPAIDFEGYGLVVNAGAENLDEKLRANDPPIVARNIRGKIMLNLTTVLPEQDKIIIKALKSCLS